MDDSLIDRARRFTQTCADAIFIYQFMVYLACWAWALCALLGHCSDVHRLVPPSLVWTLLIAPLITLVGYCIKNKAGLLLASVGDSAVALVLGRYAMALYHIHSLTLGVLLVASLSACTGMRFIRDVGQILLGRNKHAPPRWKKSSPSGS